MGGRRQQATQLPVMCVLHRVRDPGVAGRVPGAAASAAHVARWRRGPSWESAPYQNEAIPILSYRKLGYRPRPGLLALPPALKEASADGAGAAAEIPANEGVNGPQAGAAMAEQGPRQGGGTRRALGGGARQQAELDQECQLSF